MNRDFSRHNEEVQQVWAAYNDRKPIRVPFGPLGINQRIFIQNPRLNVERVTWEQFSTDPDVMFDATLRHLHYVRHNIPQDVEMGIPAEWEIGVNFFNVTEEAWFGCEVIYPEDNLPATQPRYSGANKHAIFDYAIPDPLDGIYAKVRAFHEYFQERAKNETFCDRPIKVTFAHPVWTDGPFTVATGIRGPEVLEDMLADEDYYHKLMDLLTGALIRKVRAWRVYNGYAPEAAVGGIADDAIQFLSVKTYREKVLPYHRRLYDALFPGPEERFMHLCGNVQRLLPVIVQELRIRRFDTGYPIHFGKLREALGEDVEIQGGPTVIDLLDGKPQDVFEKSREILQSGIMRGGRFIMKEANNLPPMVPVENLSAAYEAVKQFGVYS